MSSPSDLPTSAMINAWQERVAAARPFLRWAGGKRPFLNRFPDFLPRFDGRYFEPFLGGGSVYFHVASRAGRPIQAFLGDTNSALIATYRAVSSDPVAVATAVDRLASEYLAAEDREAFYYQKREEFNGQSAKRPDPELFIFLNRTCWNGVWRVNRQGAFNVPHGSPKNDRIAPTAEELSCAAAALRQAELRATSWENTIAGARAGDFVFLDPPYFSDLSQNHYRYQRNSFTAQRHRQLANSLAALKARGVDFVLTNSGEQAMADRYHSHGLAVRLVEVHRSISSKAAGRGLAPELIVTPGGAATTDSAQHDVDLAVALLTESA